MSGEIILENPIDSDACFINKNKSSIKADQLHYKNIFRNLVTRDEAENLGKCAISADFELVDYYLRPYSEEKLGFLASHQSLVVVTKKPGHNETESRSFFVKAIPYDVPSQAAYVEEKGCFRKEADFFKFIMPLMTENYRGDAWAPQCYLAKYSVLIFEDMKLKGFSNRAKTFDDDTVKSAIACIARFHASSLLAEEKLNGKSLNDLYPKLLEETEFKRTGRSYTWYITAVDLAVSIAKDLGLDNSRVREASDRIFDVCKPSSNKRNVISHGDLWSSNMLFDEANGCNLIDFQLIRYAPLAHDVMQLLYLTTTREYREKHEREIIEYYYMNLKKTLSTSGYKEIVPSHEEILQAAEEQRLPALVTAVIFHPTVLMDGRTAARIMNDPVTYETYYFKERKPFVKEIMAQNTEYETRLKEEVTELVEMSLKLDSLSRPT